MLFWVSNITYLMPGDGRHVLTKLIKFDVVDGILLSIFNNTTLFIGVSVPQDSTAKDSSRQWCHVFSAGEVFQQCRHLQGQAVQDVTWLFHTEGDGTSQGYLKKKQWRSLDWFDSENKGTTTIRNIVNCTPVDK
jgi:hypothetical protein